MLSAAFCVTMHVIPILYSSLMVVFGRRCQLVVGSALCDGKAAGVFMFHQ